MIQRQQQLLKVFYRPVKGHNVLGSSLSFSLTGSQGSVVAADGEKIVKSQMTNCWTLLLIYFKHI